MLMYSSRACFKHSNFFTVNDGASHPNNLMPERFASKMATEHECTP